MKYGISLQARACCAIGLADEPMDEATENTDVVVSSNFLDLWDTDNMSSGGAFWGTEEEDASTLDCLRMKEMMCEELCTDTRAPWEALRETMSSASSSERRDVGLTIGGGRGDD